MTAQLAALAPLRQCCLCGQLICGQLALDSFEYLGRVGVTAYNATTQNVQFTTWSYLAYTLSGLPCTHKAVNGLDSIVAQSFIL